MACLPSTCDRKPNAFTRNQSPRISLEGWCKKRKPFKTKNIDLRSKENKGREVVAKGREEEKDRARL